MDTKKSFSRKAMNSLQNNALCYILMFLKLIQIIIKTWKYVKKIHNWLRVYENTFLSCESYKNYLLLEKKLYWSPILNAAP